MINFKNWLRNKEMNELGQTPAQIFNSALANLPPNARVTDVIKNVIQKNPQFQGELQSLAADYMKAQTQKTATPTVAPTTIATQTVTPATTISPYR
jgi:hypothetical protein